MTFDAGLVNDRWYHLAVVYGSELSLFLDGVKISTWTQYNGRLESSQASPLSIGVARPNSNRWGDFSGSLAEARIYLSELSDEEIGILAGGSSVQSFTTGDSLVPPIVRVSPATLITDSNATLNYELVSYDGAQPEVIMYWGRFDQMHNEGLWENNQSLGTRGVGSGSLGIGGYSAGETVLPSSGKGATLRGLVRSIRSIQDRFVACRRLSCRHDTNCEQRNAQWRGHGQRRSIRHDLIGSSGGFRWFARALAI